MNTQTILERLQALREAINALEAIDPTTVNPETLDDDWDALMKDLEVLEELIWLEKANQMEDDRDEDGDAMIGHCGFACNFGCPSCESYDPSDEI